VKDPTGVAALYLGKREGKELVYMGKVGTGWSRTVSSQIRKQRDTVVSPKSKLTKPIKKPKATWVEPSFVADIEYRDITSEGLLRASSFKGLSRFSQGAFGPLLRLLHFQRIELLAEHAYKLGSSRQTPRRHHPFPALRTTCYAVHY
jgi:hypothetical protein